MKSHILYRFYDERRRLLYIGISVALFARLQQHGRSKEWWPHVARITLERYPDRASARAAEMAAIRTEKPLHNVQDRPKIKASRRPVFTGPQRCSVGKCGCPAKSAIGPRPVCSGHFGELLTRLHALGPDTDLHLTHFPTPVDNCRRIHGLRSLEGTSVSPQQGTSVSR